MTEPSLQANSTTALAPPPDMEPFGAPEPDWRIRLSAFAVLLLLGLTFTRVVYWLAIVWDSERGYYAHGPLVPLVCVYLVWLDRERLARLAPRPTSAGALLVAVAGALLLFGLGTLTLALQGIALLAAAFGVALTFHGWARLRATWFVWAYALVFMIPLPNDLLVELTLDMRIWTAQWTYPAVEALGVPAVLVGDSIHFPAGIVQVEEACSGLRSVMTLLALAVLFARLEPTRWKAALMVVLAIPIALLANALRVFVLCLLAYAGSPHASEGPVHEATGILIYVFAATALLALHKLPGSRSAAAVPAAAEPPARPKVANATLRALVAAALVTFAASTALRISRRNAHLKAPLPAETTVAAEVPSRFGAWIGRDVGDRPRHERVSRTRDFLLRQYRSDGLPVELFLLHRRDREGLHGPRACYLLQGFSETSRETSTLRTGERELAVTRVVIASGSVRHLVYYWHRLNGEHLGGRFALLRQRLLGPQLVGLEQVSDGATIRVSTPVDTMERAEARIRSFSRDALEAILAPVP